MRKVLTPFALSVTLLVLTLALTATGCGSEAVTTTQATTAAETPTTAAPMPTTTATTSAAAMASTTTTAPSRPITTELLPGETVLENGHTQLVGRIVQTLGVEFLPGSGPITIHLVPAGTLAEEEYQAALRGELDLAATDPRWVGYEISRAAPITVHTLSDAGEQSLTLEEFLGIWNMSPPEGGEHLEYALWLIELDTDRSAAASPRGPPGR